MSFDLKYIDIHSHINFPEYDQDREEVIQRALQNGIGMILVGTDVKSSKKCVELAEAYEGIWACVGIHPTHTNEQESDTSKGNTNAPVDFSALEELAQHPKVVALGECGLDYFHSTPEEMPLQRDIFLKHIALANKLNKPLMLHVRNGKSAEHNAYQETIGMLKTQAKVRANFHFFAGTVEDMRDIISMNNTISATGVITFARNYDPIIKEVPLTHLMSETDCPFVAPVPYRGKRNESSYVVEVVKKIAEIREEDAEKVRIQLVKNAWEFFGLNK